MKTSPHGITLIEAREGIRLTVYRDSKGIPTVGVGHVCLPEDNLKVGDKITHAQCDAFLAHDLAKAEAAVNTIKAPLTQNQFDALVSFTINIGTDGFKKSSVAKYLNARNYATAAEALMNWVKPPEIKGRRRSEQKQFLTPDTISAAQSPATQDQPSIPEVKPSVSTDQPPNTQGGDFTEGVKPPEISTGNQSADTILNKVDKVGDKWTAITAVLNKFGISDPTAARSKGTFAMVAIKTVWSVLLSIAYFVTDHWEYLVMAGLLITLAVILWDRSGRRQTDAKAGIPLEVLTEPKVIVPEVKV